MSFCYINVETKKLIFFSNLKKCTSLANDFLLHKCRNKNIFFSNLKKCTSAANEFLLHKCRNNRKMEKHIDLFFKSKKIHKHS